MAEKNNMPWWVRKTSGTSKMNLEKKQHRAYKNRKISIPQKEKLSPKKVTGQ